MGGKSDDYRQRAKEAEEIAAQAEGEDLKRVWRKVAEHWRAMAEQAERHGW